jgi:hypothetical protein
MTSRILHIAFRSEEASQSVSKLVGARHRLLAHSCPSKKTFIFCAISILRGFPQASSFRTLRALSRRNFGQTLSLKGTDFMSVMIRSSDRPIGK